MTSPLSTTLILSHLRRLCDIVQISAYSGAGFSLSGRGSWYVGLTLICEVTQKDSPGSSTIRAEYSALTFDEALLGAWARLVAVAGEARLGLIDPQEGEEHF